LSEQPPAGGGYQPYPTSAASAEQMAGTGLYGRASGPRAGFWKRFVASFVDGLIVGIPTWIVIALLFGVDFNTRRSGGTASFSLDGRAIGESVLSGVVLLVYFTILDGGPRGQSLGKRATGIRVVDAATGTSIGYGRGFARAGGKFVANILINLCLIGLLDYLWMLWDKEKQTLHDKLARSYVVPVAAYPVE
jgi:uncharacterized RDD family membrane protein YckC